MEHMALYRKWRPATFEDVVEQHHIVTTLKNSIKNNTINHAYLFCGTRGTGKTTLAKIFARAINCAYSKDGSPCNECITCKGIIDGSVLDVIEIDAASNNGVDDVREIKEAVMYVPAVTKYKVYIIDEVHMLSTGAFNALLKTLEEPPSNVIFILATTEPHKLPATILSRCQRFDFKRITILGMEERLKMIAEDCAVSAQGSALRLIARLSEGGMRDAISLLDQCIAQGVKDITYEIVAQIAGLTAQEAVDNFANAIINKNSSAALRAIKDAMDDGRDLIPLCNQLIDWFRNLMLYKTGGEALSLIDLDQEELDFIKAAAKLVSIDQIVQIIIELSQTEARLKWADNPRIIMEVTGVKLCSDIPLSTNLSDDTLESLSALEDRLRQVEVKMTMLQRGIKPADEESDKSVQPVMLDEFDSRRTLDVPAEDKKKNKNRENFKKADSNIFLDRWPEVIETIQAMKKMKLYLYLMGTNCILSDDLRASIILPKGDDSKKTVLNRAENIELIKQALKEVMGMDVRIKIINEDEINITDSSQKEKKDDKELERVKKFAEENGIPIKIEE